MAKNFDWNTYLKNNTLPILLQVVGLLVVIANLFLASQLAPLAKNIDSLNFRVNAIERRNERVDIFIDDFIAAKKDLENIHESLNRIEGLLNVHIY